MLPALRGQSKAPLHEALFWDDGTDQWAIRVGEWKLLFRKGSLALYDLQADIGEKNDLKDQNPEIVERLRQTHTAWKNQMAPQISKAKRERQTPGAAVRRSKNRQKR
jgi:arylsulfatase A-like enzyme